MQRIREKNHDNITIISIDRCKVAMFCECLRSLATGTAISKLPEKR
jgi:hypothetical protein